MSDERSKTLERPRWAGARRRGAEAPEAQLVQAAEMTPGEPLPLVYRPLESDVDLASWAAANVERLERELRHHGALMFRGFGLRTAAQFEAVARAVCPTLYGEYGDLPHEGGVVYRSTPYPPDRPILFHNEASHTSSWPLRQFFFCETPAREGGETPLVDCRRVYAALDPALRERFERHGLMYLRNFIPGLDVSWQDFFRTTDRALVEDHCRAAGVSFEWRPDGGLRMREVRPAVATHPLTGETVFFNQLQLHHASCLEAGLRESLRGFFEPNDFPRHAFFGDGSPLEDGVVDSIRALYFELSRAFPWERGDLLVLDNMLVAHARNPYVGARKILVAMGAMTRRSAPVAARG